MATSAVGRYYIHYFKINYEKYGIKQQNVSSEYIGRIKKKDVRNIRREYSKKDLSNELLKNRLYGARQFNDKLIKHNLTNLENFLNSLFSDKTYISTYQNVLTQQNQIVANQITDFSLQSLIYNNNQKGNISKLKSVNISKNVSDDDNQLNSFKRQVNIEEYNKKYAEIMKAARDLISNGDKIRGDEIIAKLKFLQKEYIDTSNRTRLHIEKVMDTLGIKGYTKLKTSDTDALVKGINALIEEYQLGIAPKYSIEGTGFEYWLATAIGIKQHSTIEEIISKVIGNQYYKTSPEVGNAVDNFSKEIGSNVFLQASYDHRNKIDVKASFKLLDNKTENMNISAKSYFSSGSNNKWINVVNNANLGEMLQLFTESQIGHLANISALSLGREKKYDDFFNEIKRGIFYQSITGNYGERGYNNSANYLILFNKNAQDSHPIRIIYINDILLMNNANKNNLSYLSVKFDGLPIKSWHLPNHWQNSKSTPPSGEKAQERVNAAISALHSTKVMASINLNALLKINNNYLNNSSNTEK